MSHVLQYLGPFVVNDWRSGDAIRVLCCITAAVTGICGCARTIVGVMVCWRISGGGGSGGGDVVMSIVSFISVLINISGSLFIVLMFSLSSSIDDGGR